MSLLSKRKPEELKGVRNFFKIVSLPSWPRALQSVPIVLVCAIHRLIRFVYSILIPFVGSSLPPFRVLLRHQLKVSQFAVERIYIDYNVKIRQIDKIDKSILMAIQQRKIYIFHQGPGWSSVFPMLSCLDRLLWLCSVASSSSLICVSILKKRDTAAATALLHNR